jgi:hypothetical protein
VAASVLATFINPYGWTVYRYVFATSSIAYERQIAEWVRPGPHNLIGLVWMASVVCVVGLMAWRWRRSGQQPALRHVLLLGCFLVLSAGSVRMVAWWMLVSAPVLAELLVWLAPGAMGAVSGASHAHVSRGHGTPNDNVVEMQPSLAAGGMFCVVVLAVAFSLPGLDQFNPLLGPTRRGQRVEQDLEAVHHYLELNAPPGSVYSHFEWGEYLSWAMPPRYRIFMDGRIEIYPDVVWRQYTVVTLGKKGWEEILQAYGVDYLILDTEYHGRSGLLARVAESPHWHRAFQARSAILYVRTPSESLSPQ